MLTKILKVGIQSYSKYNGNIIVAQAGAKISL